MKNAIFTVLSIIALLFCAKTLPAQWESMTQMPTHRALAATAVLDGRIYVIGGAFNRNDMATHTVEAYDPVTNTWDTTIQDLPIPICAATAETVDGKIYVMGGQMRYSGTKFKYVLAFDPENGWEERADLPRVTAWHASAVLDNKIYVVGGLQSDVAHALVEMYDPETNVWTSKASLPGARAVHAAETVGSEIYVFGGLFYGESRSTVYAYNAMTDSWTQKADMPSTKFHHRADVIDGNIYIMGGIKNMHPGEASPSVWKYDVAADSWEDLQLEMPEVIAAFGCEVAPDASEETSLFSLGGATANFFTDDPGPRTTGSVIKYLPQTVAIHESVDPGIEVIVYPNPAQSSAQIQYTLNKSTPVSLTIYTLSGETVKRWDSGMQAVGAHQIFWHPVNIERGVYLVQLSSSNGQVTEKVILQ